MTIRPMLDSLACFIFMLIGNAAAAAVADLSNADAANGLRQALDGLYFMIGEQEKAFRQNPLGATSDIVKKVFGALR